MTDQAAMVNRALQSFGSRTTITAAQLAANSNNESIQANIFYAPARRRLLRMAPWNCAAKSANLTYITSAPGTPENPAAPVLSTWAPGQPAPPWAYEYQYPVDCLRACWVTPQTATGYASGIPITTAVTGGAPSFWQGPPVKYVVATDRFYNITGTSDITNGGLGYAVGDLIFLATSATTVQQNNLIGVFQANAPQGAGAILQVATIGAGGAVETVNVIGITPNENTPFSGSYFYSYSLSSGVATQVSTTGAGVGFTCIPNFGGPGDQRVILTNQEFAILNYIKDITDENVFDDDFLEAFALVMGARLCTALTGDKKLANLKIAEANAMILEARGSDGNEGLRVNDVTPDWLRVRGIDFTEDYSGPYNTGFNWGSLWPGYT